jgi:hypothetical protein
MVPVLIVSAIGFSPAFAGGAQDHHAYSLTVTRFAGLDLLSTPYAIVSLDFAVDEK